MAVITFPFYPVVGVWEVLCSQAISGIKEGPSPFPSGYTGGVLILLQLVMVLRGEDHIPRVTYFHLYIYLYDYVSRPI